MMAVAAIDATVTVVLSVFGLRYWGLAGAAGATAVAALVAAVVSFSIGFSRFGLTLPIGHLIRIALATIAMAALLRIFSEAPTAIFLVGHIGAGAAAYLATLAVLYAPSLFRMLRARPQHSEA
jgi:peptidoglycan biosynthesis protein MviN/MurJ (putative lipid II flippase)